MKTMTSVIILAGGIGTRMQTHPPKQFLKLGNKIIVRHSFDLFLEMSEIDEIIVVCDPFFQYYFTNSANTKLVRFALPGERRQDSVYNGLQQVSPACEIVCVHDGARPFIDKQLVLRALEAGKTYGAATVGMPIKFTVKQSDLNGFVKATPDRAQMWEIQTPQVIRHSILAEGFKHALKHNLTVTDDVSLAELINKEVKLVEGSHENLKITVPSDLTIATSILNEI